MNLQEWKDKFYPTEASEFSGLENNLDNAIKAVQHSLIKWKGLQWENLDNMRFEYYTKLVDEKDDHLTINYESCACCQLTFCDETRCTLCPITLMTGHDCNSTFEEWEDNHNPENMIALLEETLLLLEGTDEDEYIELLENANKETT